MGSIRNWRLGLLIGASVLLGAWLPAVHGAAQAAPATPPQTQATPAKPAVEFAPGSEIEPAQLAKMLAQGKEKAPVVCVGFKFLYDSAHVPGALYLGPARTPQGLDTLKKWAEPLPRNKTIVLYCGCCPWEKCPNIRPAYAALKGMGFTQLKVVHIAGDFGKDWVNQGFPVEKTAPGAADKK